MPLVFKAQARRRYRSTQAGTSYRWHLLEGGPKYSIATVDSVVEVKIPPSRPLAQVDPLCMLDLTNLLGGHISLGEPVPRVWRTDALRFPKQEKLITLELFGEKEWIASLPDARIFAEGKGPEKAKRNLLRKSRRDLQFLRRNKDKLGSLLQQKLAVLLSLF